MYFWISAFDHRAIVVPKMHIVHCRDTSTIWKKCRNCWFNNLRWLTSLYYNSHFSPAQMGLLDYAMIALWVEEQLWSWKGISLQITHALANGQHILDSQPKTSSHALMAQLSAYLLTTCTGQLSQTKAKCLTTCCRLQMQAKSKAERSNAASDWCGTLTVFIVSLFESNKT